MNLTTTSTEIMMLAIKKLNRKKPVRIQNILKGTNYSWHYANRVMSMLRRAGYVRSTQGRYGGYVLTSKLIPSPSKVTLLTNRGKTWNARSEFVHHVLGTLNPHTYTKVDKLLVKCSVTDGNAYTILTKMRRLGLIKATRGKEGGWIRTKKLINKNTLSKLVERKV